MELQWKDCEAGMDNFLKNIRTIDPFNNLEIMSLICSSYYKINEERNNYIQIIEKLKPEKKSQTPIFSVSIDSRLLFFSETPIDNNLDDKKVLDWFITQALGSVNDSTIETFHYPFTSNQNKYFNIHIPKMLKIKIRFMIIIFKSIDIY